MLSSTRKATLVINKCASMAGRKRNACQAQKEKPGLDMLTKLVINKCASMAGRKTIVADLGPSRDSQLQLAVDPAVTIVADSFAKLLPVLRMHG